MVLPKKRINGEAKLRVSFLRILKETGQKYRRIENTANSGMFDLLVQDQKGVFGFVELKYSSTFKKGENPIKLLRPSQRAFALEFAGKSLHYTAIYIVVSNGKDMYVYPIYAVENELIWARSV